MNRDRLLSAMLSALILAGCAFAFAPKAVWTEPAAYRYTFTASCGERSLYGTFDVSVEDGNVDGFRAIDQSAAAYSGGMANLPTLGDLHELAEEALADEDAEVELQTDEGDGHLILLDIDWLPNAIDDEECYRITSYIPEV